MSEYAPGGSVPQGAAPESSPQPPSAPAYVPSPAPAQPETPVPPAQIAPPTTAPPVPASAPTPPPADEPLPTRSHGLNYDPLWFKTAVFYEVWVRSFYDSNGTGVGDPNGLAARLDYLQWLGIDCIWIPPFFLSPERDRGYDVQFMKNAARRFDIEISDD